MDFSEPQIWNNPGEKAERKVWETIKKAFLNRQALAHPNYSIFPCYGNSKLEIYILIMDRKLGLILIEVKGLKINEILSIKGPT